MYRMVALALAVSLASAACSDGDDAAAEPSPEPSLPVATVLLDNGDESTLVTVEVAETPEQHELGLSGRQSLPQDEGLVFVFLEGRSDALEVNAARVPLSVAFFDASGGILGIGSCDRDPCRVDGPGREFMGAIAVNEGSFEEWDISEGDHVQLTR